MVMVLEQPRVLRSERGEGDPPPASPAGVLDDVRVADTLADVLNAWGLVHDAYVRSGLIRPNRAGLHTSSYSASHGAVVLGAHEGRTVVTMTTIQECEQSLPLDAVFPDELAFVRRGGRRLAEIGLFAQANTPEGAPLAACDLRRVMAHALAVGFAGGAEGVVIGVHPRHAPLYRRMWGFERASDERPHPDVEDAPCVLLRVSRDALLARASTPRELIDALAGGQAARDLAQAYDFAAPCPRLDEFLYGVGAAGARSGGSQCARRSGIRSAA